MHDEANELYPVMHAWRRGKAVTWHVALGPADVYPAMIHGGLRIPSPNHGGLGIPAPNFRFILISKIVTETQ
jgi:hypothetical protein